MRYEFAVVSRPSCDKTIVSIATSFPSAFRSVDCTFDGQALCTVHVMAGLCCSSSNLIVTVRRKVAFFSWNIKVFFHCVKNSLSPKKVPRFSVISEYLVIPGCLVLLYLGESPLRYSMTWVSKSSPVTSVNPIRVPPQSRRKWNFGIG